MLLPFSFFMSVAILSRQGNWSELSDRIKNKSVLIDDRDDVGLCLFFHDRFNLNTDWKYSVVLCL
jgi:hypothetical protein